MDLLTARSLGSITASDVVIAVLTGMAGVTGSYALAGFTPRFIVAPIDAFVVDLTPGWVIAFVIQRVGDAGHLLHIAMSFGIAVGLLAGTAIGGVVVARHWDRPFSGTAMTGLLTWALTAAMTGAPVVAVGAAAPVALLAAFAIVPRPRVPHDPARRRVIGAGASLLAVIWVTIGIEQFGRGGEEDDSPPSALETDDPAVERLFAAAADKSLSVNGEMPGLVSTFEEFYNVDIATYDPELSPDEWSLTITGEVDEDVTVTYDELTGMPTERRFVTLRCVGEPLNGHKLDNAVWTGTPIKPLLERADPEGACGCAMVRAADGYFVQFPIEALEDGFLAWGMNGQALPRSHGHPVRVLIPGHWGETNVKWLNEIELLDAEMDGYWEQKGWHGTGPVNTVAKLWSTAKSGTGEVEVAGHAYAGTRGIDRVEVSTDGGDTWVDAELSPPLPGDDVWRQWRYTFPAEGTHEVVVRAIDGEGTRQPADRAESFPSGATGWVRRSVNERGVVTR